MDITHLVETPLLDLSSLPPSPSSELVLSEPCEIFEEFHDSALTIKTLGRRCWSRWNCILVLAMAQSLLALAD